VRRLLYLVLLVWYPVIGTVLPLLLIRSSLVSNHNKTECLGREDNSESTVPVGHVIVETNNYWISYIKMMMILLFASPDRP
jgi:hypothetical protein